MSDSRLNAGKGGRLTDDSGQVKLSSSSCLLFKHEISE